MIQQYTQTTYETCLACCLLQAVQTTQPIEITQETELACIIHSMKFSKDDFVIGHLDFIINTYGVNIQRIVDNTFFAEYLKKIPTAQKIRTEVQKIDLRLIDAFLDRKPILYIDSFYLYQFEHYPHFITVLGKAGDAYRIADPWDGKEKIIASKTLAQAVSSLRNHIKMCPQLLVVEKASSR